MNRFVRINCPQVGASINIACNDPRRRVLDHKIRNDYSKSLFVVFTAIKGKMNCVVINLRAEIYINRDRRVMFRVSKISSMIRKRPIIATNDERIG